MRPLLLSLATVAVTVVSLRPARACTDAGTCFVAKFPAPASGLPANTPAIPFTPSTGATATAPSLYTEAGALWPTTITSDTSGRKFLVPTTPLTENAKWKVQWEDACATTSSPAQYAFDTITTKPLPTTLGTLFTKVGKASVSRDSCGSTNVSVHDGGSNAASVRLDLAPDLEPFRAVTEYEVLVDDEPLRRAEGIGGDPYAVVTPCGSSENLWDAFVTTPGKHTFKARARVANQPPTPWVTTDVTLSCSGTTTTDAAGDAVSDAGSDGGSSSMEETKSGCATGSGRANGGPAVLLLALALLRRRLK